MQADWENVVLGDVAEVTVGHVGPMASEYVGDGIPFLRSLNIRPHAIDLTDVKYIAPAFHERLGKSALKPGDVVTVRTGKPGATAVVPEHLPVANCSDVVITRPGTRLDPRWLSYYINGVANGFVASRLVGAVQQHFNVSSAKEIRLGLPPLADQHAIAATLGALDDKIESNGHVIRLALELLDALAADAVTRISTFVPLGEFASASRETVSPARLGKAIIDHFSIPAFDNGALPERSRSSTILSNKLMVRHPSILVSRLNPRFNRTWLCVPDEVPALASTEFLVLSTADPAELGALWLAVRDEYFRAELARRVTGTSGSHQRIRAEDAMAIDVPDVRMLPANDKQRATELLALVHQRRHENRHLAALRDALLPALLSGRLRIRTSAA